MKHLSLPPLHAAGMLKDCVLLTYRTDADSVADLLPDGLSLTTRGRYAFWNILACRVEAMRPLGTPGALGVTYHQMAYRLRVHALADNADRLEGLYFVRSEADHRAITALGNYLSDFCFSPADITLQADANTWQMSVQGDARAELAVIPTRRPARPTGSCFATLLDAEEFCQYPPLALSVHEGDAHLAEVHRDPEAWRTSPVEVKHARWDWLEALGQHDLLLEHAVRVDPVAYRWTLGRKRRLLPASLSPTHLSDHDSATAVALAAPLPLDQAARGSVRPGA